MKSFTEIGVSAQLVEALDRLNFKTPTPIQEQTIPLILNGQDILGSAPTGTGKTGAFAIPLIQRMLENKKEQVLILSPTRELAMQIMQAFQQILGKKSSIRSALLIGGAPMFPQIRQLQDHPRLVIGTPGRINDHLARGTLSLDQTTQVVLDETDRMLDLGFGVQIKEIVEYLPEDHQTLMFSATMPHSIMKLANSYLRNPVRISVGQASAPSVNVTQSAVLTTDQDKHRLLMEQIDRTEGSIIVFVKTKRSAEALSKKLNVTSPISEAIHGDLRQAKREKIIRAFRGSKFRIMIATDVAARGIDIPHIQQVINYDLPQCAEDYIHRIGRTGRASGKGEAISFISPSDNGKWRAIRRLIGTEAARDLPEAGAGGDSERPRRGGRRMSSVSGRDKDRREKSFGSRSSDNGFGRRDRSSFDAPSNNSFGRRDRSSSDAPSGNGFGRRDRSSSDAPSSNGFGRRDRSSSDAPSSNGFGRRDRASSDISSGNRFDRRGDFTEAKPAKNRFSEGRRERSSSDRPGRPARAPFGEKRVAAAGASPKSGRFKSKPKFR